MAQVRTRYVVLLLRNSDISLLENETAVIRYDYLDPQLGTCQETINGGNHFRYWVQDGDDANSGAIFMAVSYEMPVAREFSVLLAPIRRNFFFAFFCSTFQVTHPLPFSYSATRHRTQRLQPRSRLYR